MSYFHPNDKILRFILQKRIDCTAVLWYTNKARNRNNDSISGCGAVGSALPWGGRGRWFKSSHSDQSGAPIRELRIGAFLMFKFKYSYLKRYIFIHYRHG